MAEEMKDFLVSLSKDAKRLEAYRKDPDAVMSTAGLSNAEIAIIKSGNRELIAKAISPNDPQALGLFVIIVVSP